MSAFLLVAALVGAPAWTQSDGPRDNLPRWGLSFAAGPYQPVAGDERERDYYISIYASNRDVPKAQRDDSLFKFRPLLMTIEFDWYLTRRFGLLGLTVRFGQWHVDAPTRICYDAADSPQGCTTETVKDSKPGNDTTALSVTPVGLGLVYRMDLLKRDFGIPLVPYVKGGVDYYLWRNTAGGKVSRVGNLRASGGTLGLEATAGLALNLDWLEPDVATRASASADIADTYLFGEISRFWANGFGDTTRFDFSTDRFIQAGIAIDFH